MDDAHGVITATETTSGDVEENAKLFDLVDQHEQNAQQKVETVIADQQYGTADNFCKCQERGVRSHMGDISAAHQKKSCYADIFSSEDFKYQSESNCYICPAGQTLKRRKQRHSRMLYEYACSVKICSVCALRQQCTRAREGRVRAIKRHYKQELVDAGRAQSRTQAAQRDRRRRQWLMEGSFANSANNHGFKRSRWRRLWRQQIQDYLIAAVQNVRILIRHCDLTPKTVGQEVQTAVCNIISAFSVGFESLIRNLFCTKSKNPCSRGFYAKITGGFSACAFI